MSLVKIQGNTLGTGTLLIAAPNTNSDITLNLPTTMGTNNGSSVVTTDAAGNLGLGVAPSAWSSWKAMQIGARASFVGNTTASFVANNFYYDGADGRYIATANASLYEQSAGTHKFFTAPSGTAGAAISFVQAMTLDASGNLGVGVTSMSSRLQASSTNATTYSSTNTLASGAVAYIKNDSTTNSTAGTIRLEATGSGSAAPVSISAVHTGDGAAALTFGNRPNSGSDVLERARIDSSGNLLVGTTSQPGAGSTTKGVQASASGVVLACRNAASGYVGYWTITGGSGGIHEFYSGTTVVGSITTNGTSTSFNTSSDYRLKHGIAPMTGALAKVAALKPCTYKWKVDGSDGQGFIAHELAEVVAGCVTGEKDAVDEEGKPQYQGIDTSFLVATLTAAIQELKAIVDAQGAQIAMQSSEIATLTAAVAASKGTA